MLIRVRNKERLIVNAGSFIQHGGSAWTFDGDKWERAGVTAGSPSSILHCPIGSFLPRQRVSGVILTSLEIVTDLSKDSGTHDGSNYHTFKAALVRTDSTFTDGIASIYSFNSDLDFNGSALNEFIGSDQDMKDNTVLYVKAWHDAVTGSPGPATLQVWGIQMRWEWWS